MDYTEYTSAKNKLGASPNLCDLFKLLSIETWKRMEFTYIKSRVKLFETTITQNLIFSINAYKDQYGLDIEIYEARDERTNGNDFELIIRFPKEKLEYYSPVQAKKIYRDGRYLSMDHGDQIDSLIAYAKTKKSEPLYLLYNFVPEPFKPGITLGKHKELSGCTFVSANYLFKQFYKARTKIKADGSSELTWQIPNFFDLNPNPAFEWHQLVCPSEATKLRKVLKGKDLISTDGLGNPNLPMKLDELNQGFFPLDTFKKGNDWVDFKEITIRSAYEDSKKPGRIPDDMLLGDSSSKEKENSKQKVYPEFAPQSRVVLTHD